MVCNLYLPCNIFCQDNLIAARIRNFIVLVVNFNHRTIEDGLIAIHLKYIVGNRLFRCSSIFVCYGFCQIKILKLATNRTICTGCYILYLSRNLYIIVAVCIGNLTLCCFCCFLKQTNCNRNPFYWNCRISCRNCLCELDVIHICIDIFIRNSYIDFFLCCILFN